MRRRTFLTGVGATIGGLALSRPAIAAASGAETVELPFTNGARSLAAYPQKRPLIVLTSRPVQLETPFAVFDESLLTPNDAFFVRWHLAGVPTSVDPAQYALTVRGLVDKPATISLAELRTGFAPAEVTAVCECAGNSRGFFQPRVAGGQWANGAMGNARWRGARLKDVLARAGVAGTAKTVRFSGMDRPVLAGTPSFKKSLDVDIADGDDVLLAYEMNGEPLPLLNGFPVRLVVPGWYATYWVKMLNDIEVRDAPDDNFWMTTAYRVPAAPCGCQEPGTKVPTVPISKLTVRSFITNLVPGASVDRQGQVAVRGIAFDSGSGIAKVMFSSDNGASWSQAALGADEGRYGFREWSASFSSEPGKRYALQCAATSVDGSTQPSAATWNASGYMRNAVETLDVAAAS
ncbi:MAG TPA: molybdopterin-dependent oxidoreductase [Candidatus Eremiobacteraceae bacterium]|nr:molybdopterin-dependent oxidoreductase [Candidatus Eremiobacteraceae bacterium]